MSTTISTKSYNDGDYKRSTSIDKRKEESARTIDKYPDMIPIIFERQKNSTIPYLDKCKIMISDKCNVSSFIFAMRQRVKLKPEEAFYIYVNNTIPNMSMLMSQLYKENKDDDGFLYIVYASEATFG